jgi:hypothetical protein
LQITHVLSRHSQDKVAHHMYCRGIRNSRLHTTQVLPWHSQPKVAEHTGVAVTATTQGRRSHTCCRGVRNARLQITHVIPRHSQLENCRSPISVGSPSSQPFYISRMVQRVTHSFRIPGNMSHMSQLKVVGKHASAPGYRFTSHSVTLPLS